MDATKLKSLVLYVCDRVSDPSKLGSTKLNKILYYSDFIHFQRTGSSITGEKYVKQKHGPVPFDILKIEEELINEGRLVRTLKDHFGYLKKHYFALEEADISTFSADEISLVDEMIEIITEGHTADSISNFSHNHIWESADIGQEIPYETAFVNQLGEFTPEENEWVYSLIEKRESERKSA